MKIFFKQIIIIDLILLFSALPLFGQDGFTSFMTDENIPVLQWSGEGIINTRYNTDYSNITKSKIDVYPEINLNLDYSSDRSEFHGRINISANPNYQTLDEVSQYLEQMIDEAWFQIFFNNFNIETGYIKLTWGKGNKAFTFDNLNAVDYTDFINPSYMDRKIAETMIKINIPFGMQGMVEAVYTPVFTPDVYPTDGDWVQTDYKIWEAKAQSNSFSISPEDTSTLAKSQLGLHITDSRGGFDVGASYQYTFLRKAITDFSTIGDDGNLPLSWDRVHLFGAETAFVVAAFNIWAEIAYYMTSDFSGNDPLVHNNRLLYLLGFSRDLMIHNISLNIQGKSELILGSDGVTDTSDIDYESDTAYNSYLLTAGLRDSFLNEKITAELNGSYSMKDGDFMIVPELKVNLLEDTWLNMKYTFFYGDSAALFGQFEDNDFLEIRMKYSF